MSELDLVVSSDDSGMIEIWDPETYEFPSTDFKKLKYELITDTDFLELAKAKTFALSMAVSNNGEILAIYARDRKVRIFNIITGKLLRTVDDQT
jgi:peptidylprolyl isomerase domain and WD repeat-containing protein 1